MHLVKIWTKHCTVFTFSSHILGVVSFVWQGGPEEAFEQPLRGLQVIMNLDKNIFAESELSFAFCRGLLFFVSKAGPVECVMRTACEGGTLPDDLAYALSAVCLPLRSVACKTGEVCRGLCAGSACDFGT